MMSWRDRWWYMNYCWHRWRLERNHLAACDHILILEGHLGLDIEKVRIKRHRSHGFLVPPKDKEQR